MAALNRLGRLRQALRQLGDEASYTAADAPVAACRVVKRMLDAVALLPAQLAGQLASRP